MMVVISTIMMIYNDGSDYNNRGVHCLVIVVGNVNRVVIKIIHIKTIFKWFLNFIQDIND